jgi:hypothetical protein
MKGALEMHTVRSDQTSLDARTGRAIAEAVSRRLPTAVPWVRVQVRS